MSYQVRESFYNVTKTHTPNKYKLIMLKPIINKDNDAISRVSQRGQQDFERL